MTFSEGQTSSPITATWLNMVDAFVNGGGSAVTYGGSGTTAERPVNPKVATLYIDTDLKQPIICDQNTPTVIWINFAGVQV